MLAPLQNGLRQLFPRATVVPMYGLTECKRVSISTDALVRRAPNSVGLPLPGTTVEIVTATGRVADAEEPGEAVVSGFHVASGYYDRTAEDDTLRKAADGSWRLHTGDLVSRDASGALFHHGRITRDLIKVRDERISLVFVEETLRAFDGITEVVVTPHVDEYGLIDRLDAAVQLSGGGQCDFDAVRRAVRAAVGAAAASALTFRKVPLIHLSDHGKVAGQMDAGGTDTVSAALAAAWQRAVGDDKPLPDPDYDWLASGDFDSLILIDVASNLEEALSIKIPARVFVPEKVGTVRTLLATLEQLVDEQARQ